MDSWQSADNDIRSDAARWRWLKRYLHVQHSGDFTCWLEIDFIPVRSRARTPDEIMDQLLERFPFEPLRAAATDD